MSKLLLYCTKSKKRLFFDKLKQIFTLGKVKSNNGLNGKIVAECDYEVEEIFMGYGYETFAKTKTMQLEEILKRSCLSENELCDYLPNYAIHINNLHIFDEPKELSDYCVYTKPTFDKNNVIEKAPQNMCRVLTKNGYEYILISIRPQWLCKILNGEKTIEVRKKVLKEMIK